MADGVDGPFTARRDRRGRFQKGASGNPSGRPPGILNEATRTAAVLLGGEAGALTRKAIELGLSGDIAALRLCIDRIIAPRREQPVAFAMPAMDRAGDLPAAMAALTRAAATGVVTPAEAAAFAQVVEAQARVIETTARVEAELLAARQTEITARYDLRVCVVMAHLLEGCSEGEAVRGIAERCAELRRIGRAARDTLAAIPDTPDLVDADRGFIAAHKLPLDRVAHPLAAAMSAAWQRLSADLDRTAQFNRNAQSA